MQQRLQANSSVTEQHHLVKKWPIRREMNHWSAEITQVMGSMFSSILHNL